MTPEAAVQDFLSGFGMPAYATASVPGGAAFPYISYDLVIPDYGEVAAMTVNVWYRTTSESEPNAKVREIGRAIGHGGVILECDDGVVWLTKGSPWAQAISVAEEDDMVKRRYLNVNAEFFTFD